MLEFSPPVISSSRAFLASLSSLQLFKSPEALLPQHDRVSQNMVPISHILVGKLLLSPLSYLGFLQALTVPFVSKFNSSGKKLCRWYLSMPFNLRGCQAKKVAVSILYTLCFYLSSEVKRLFSNLEPQTWFMIKLTHSVHSHTWTLEGNCHSPLQLIARKLILPGS